MLKIILQYFGHPNQRTDSLQKTPILRKIEGTEKGTLEGEMVEWHYRLNGHEFEHTPEVGDGQGSLACCSAWIHKVSDMTERLNYLSKG